MPHDCGVRSMRLHLVLPHSETEKSETKYQEFLVGATAKATAYCGSHGPHISTFPVVCNKENQVCGCRGPPNNHKSKGFLSRPYTRVVAGVKKRPRNQHGMFSCYLSRTRQAHIHEEKSGDGTDLKGTTRTARTIAAVSEPCRRKRRKPPPSQLATTGYQRYRYTMEGTMSHFQLTFINVLPSQSRVEAHPPLPPFGLAQRMTAPLLG